MRLKCTFVLLLLLTVGILAGCGPAANSASTNSAAAKTNTNAALPEVDPFYGHLNHALPNLPTVKVWLGSAELTTEICSQQLELNTGMMFRTNMLETQAMIFIFPDAMPRSFYMRNCTVPLTAAYINPDGVIEEFAKLNPGNEIGVPSKSRNIQFVLEVPQGWHERHNVSTGAVVRTERGSLQETFFKR